MALNSKFFAVVPFLGLGSVSFVAGYKTYRLVWPKKWFEPKLMWGEPMTFAQHQEKMTNFQKQILENEKEETTVYLWDIPMPGNTMVWAHQNDEIFWQQRSETLKQLKDQGQFGHIPHEVNKLKSWCSLHLNTRVHVSKGDNSSLKFRISKDDHVYAKTISTLNDLSDIKNNCARLVTNGEFYETQMIKESSSEECQKLSQQPYGSSSQEFKKCLKTKDEKSTSYVISTLISYFRSLLI